MTQVRGEKGFTLFELIVVIAIISVLAAFALDRYARLLVDVERTSMQHDLGVMRSAISMQFAGHYVAGNKDAIENMINGNPMTFLTEQPSNYLGEFKAVEAQVVEAGNWYFDTDEKALVYLVRHVEYFETELVPERARFKIFPVYSEKQIGETKQSYLSGLRLKAIEPYRWLKN